MTDDDNTGLFALVADRIARDERMRRSLLWLRAMERDDLRTVRALEALDPGLTERWLPDLVALARAGVNFEDRRARRRVFAALQDRLWEREAAEVVAWLAQRRAANDEAQETAPGGEPVPSGVPRTSARVRDRSTD